jgi:hypothetical protein
MYRYRSTGVSLIAALSFILGLLWLISALSTLAIPLPDPFGRFTLVLGLLCFILAVLYLGLGWGLWELREWARLTAMVISALVLVANLVAGVALIAGVDVGGVPLRFPGVGAGSLIVAAIAAFILYYLARPDVREVFQGAYVEPVSVSSPTVPHRVTPEPVPPPPPPATELIFKSSLPTAWLVHSLPGHTGRQLPLRAGRNTIGRDGSRCQVTLDDPTVSAEHAAIVFEHGRFVLYDLASRNHTYLNGQRIQRQMLYDGDEIRLGNNVLVFKRV